MARGFGPGLAQGVVARSYRAHLGASILVEVFQRAAKFSLTNLL